MPNVIKQSTELAAATDRMIAKIASITVPFPVLSVAIPKSTRPRLNYWGDKSSREPTAREPKDKGYRPKPYPWST
jgi:hypothetical protein